MSNEHNINDIFVEERNSNTTLEENESRVIINNQTSQPIKYYKPDKIKVRGKKRCDWLLVDEVPKEVYIELKSRSNVYKAYEQIIQTYQDFHDSNIKSIEFYIVFKPIYTVAPKLYQNLMMRLSKKYRKFKIKKIKKIKTPLILDF